jgi:hypothetical protein
MTPERAAALEPGDRVCNGSLKGAVTINTENFVQLRWDDRPGYDILRKTSPLWRFLEVIE